MRFSGLPWMTKPPRRKPSPEERGESPPLWTQLQGACDTGRRAASRRMGPGRSGMVAMPHRRPGLGMPAVARRRLDAAWRLARVRSRRLLAIPGRVRRLESARVIVTIPTYLSRPGQAAQLARCVAALLADSEPARVVVVDDGSPLAPAAAPGAGRCAAGSLPTRGPPRRATAGSSGPSPGARTWCSSPTPTASPPRAGRGPWRAFLADGRHAAAGGVTRSLGTTLLDRYHDFTGSLNGRWILPGRRELLYADHLQPGGAGQRAGGVRFDERFPACGRRGLRLLPPAARARPSASPPARWCATTSATRAPGAGSRLPPDVPALRGGRSAAVGEAPGAPRRALRGLRRRRPAGRPSRRGSGGYRRGASSRVRPRRFRLPWWLLRWASPAVPTGRASQATSVARRRRGPARCDAGAPGRIPAS